MFLIVYWTSLPDHLFGDGMVLQPGGLLLARWGTSWRFCRWSVSLHRWSRLLELQSEEIWFPVTFSWSSLTQPQHKEVLRPIWTCSPLPPRCIRIVPTLGKDPWSQVPKCRRYPPKDCSSEALRLGNWYFRVFYILGNAARIHLLLHTCLAKRIRFAKLLHALGRLRNVLHRVRSGNALESCGSQIAGYNGGVNH